MIGLATRAGDLEIAKEFFELFKTPWEIAAPKRQYSIVLSTIGDIDDFDAPLVVVYASREEAIDRRTGVTVTAALPMASVEWSGHSFPIYGTLATFEGDCDSQTITCGGRSLLYRRQTGSKLVVRIGYDLFNEIRFLLTAGQPLPHALTPTLELHIALLRSLLQESAVPFVEIPPRPHNRDFVCCLTHDLDFFGVRRHRFDRTLAGFVIRASVGTLSDLIRGRRPLSEAVRNWIAVLRLPLVMLGLSRDFWQPIEDYAQVEDGSRSTFFIVPFKGRISAAPDGRRDPVRAVPYQASEIRDELAQAVSRGSEMAVHGIDAWQDAGAGRAEMRELMSATGRQPAGVRMHWLYYAPGTPAQLEDAGFEYDSTWGYNDAVGYRAGTSQVFRLPGTTKLMELPLSIMDSALFYGHRMGLSRKKAKQLCSRILENARRFGGTVVINWHDRSLAPERLWGRPYQELVMDAASGNRTWFATASETVAWFRWRRSIRFVADSSSRVTVTASTTAPASLAGSISIFRPAASTTTVSEEVPFDGLMPLRLEL